MEHPLTNYCHVECPKVQDYVCMHALWQVVVADTTNKHNKANEGSPTHPIVSPNHHTV